MSSGHVTFVTVWEITDSISEIVQDKIQLQWKTNRKQEGQHPLTGQRAANFRLLANQ